MFFREFFDILKLASYLKCEQMCANNISNVIDSDIHSLILNLYYYLSRDYKMSD